MYFLPAKAMAITLSVIAGFILSAAAADGKWTYLVDPANGDDANPAGKPWKTFGKLNSIKLAPGDKVLIAPGRQEQSLKPMGAGTAEKPVVIQFLPGIHTIGIGNVERVPMYVSNSMDSDEPKPVGILIEGCDHLRLEGGGVDGEGKTTILFDGRMVQVYNHNAGNVTFTGLVFDLKRPTVSEFRVLEAGPASAVIQVAESSDYVVRDGKFLWQGDWGPGAFFQKLDVKEGRCRRFPTPRGWTPEGQMEAAAKDLGGRKVQLDYPGGESGLEAGHQYHIRNIRRDSVGVHNARSKDIVFRDCDFYALTGMGMVSQFTENLTFQRVNVAPPRGTIRTCPAWADIFQFSNCKGHVLIDSCRLSGMQDDAINCHGTYMRIIEKIGDNQLLLRFMHPQTYGFAAFVPGDEVSVICGPKLREYEGNPRRKVTALERKSDRDWILTLDGPVPHFGDKDVINNITWHPDITVRNNHFSVAPVSGFLLTTPGKAVVENNTFHRCRAYAISMSADSLSWFESAPVRDVLIRGNTFVECGVWVNPAIKSVKPEEPIHENIRIIDNLFERSGVNATGARNLTITGNRSEGEPMSVVIDPSCTDVKIENPSFSSMGIRAGERDSLRAFHTRTNPSPVGHIGKYEDLVVALGETNRLEFLRANGYQPQWRTANGIQRVEHLIPKTTEDPDANYSSVRLIENGPEKVVVQWRHFRDIAAISMANEALDPIHPQGITGVIHELFTVYPDGRVEREIREAANTRYQDWIDPRLATRQTLKLTDTGIGHGTVIPGRKPPLYPRASIEGGPVKKNQALPALLHHWNFDEGMTPHEDHVSESVGGARCEITGLMTPFKKGVSGTALALDGYYTGVTMDSKPASHEALTVTAWVALDTYPYNHAPLVHQSKAFGAKGWYLGLDAYGHPFITVAGQTVKASETVLPLYQWAHVGATIGSGGIRLYVDGREVASGDFKGTFTTPDTPLILGRNNELERNTDPVRRPKHNLQIIYGIQGLLDEITIHSIALTAEQVEDACTAMRPADGSSDLAKGVLPGELGTAQQFGASYKSLPVSDVWDQLWRDLPGADIVVKFDNNPCSVIFWRGTNHAANWVTDNNRWMTDQSSENGGPHGCSEHMADKQNRHCRSSIIENSPARVVIHWRYPCVDVSYKNLTAGQWTDEYHTIHPDGTGVRQVVWNGSNGNYGPAFQDIQILTNPGESALDVMNLQAMDVANLKGETLSLTWEPPNIVPKNTLTDATIERINTKSENKVFAMFQGGLIFPWGAKEQSKYVVDPFPGMWNHWPMHLVPSDGRFAVATDRVTHFSLAANDASNKFGSMVLYGFTRQEVGSLVPLARFWSHPPDITALSGCTTERYRKESREYPLVAEKESMTVRIDANDESPLVNPCFTIRNWGHRGAARVTVTGADAKEIRQGLITDTDGTKTMVIWLELAATSSLTLGIGGANLDAGYVPPSP